MPLFILLLLAVSVCAPGAHAQSSETAQWIWGPASAGYAEKVGEYGGFRATLDLKRKPKKAILRMAADNHFVAWVNGKRVLAGDQWNAPATGDRRHRIAAQSRQQ